MRLDAAALASSPVPRTFTTAPLVIRPRSYICSGVTVSRPSLAMTSRLTTWYSTRVGFTKPRFGIRR